MSIKGQSFTGAFSGGAHMDFDVGTGGMASVFASDYTIAVLAKVTSSSWGFFGAYADTSAATAIRQFFLSNNSGARLFGDSDFSSGFPAAVDDADGLNDGVWRWHVISKATGSAHYKFNYADLSTLTWIDGEAPGAANHSDNATTPVMLSTWAVYSNGFDSGDLAAIVVWPTQMSATDIHRSCTFQASDFKKVSTPVGGWLFKQSDVIAGTIHDFTGGGANENARPNITNSADPPGFRWDLTEHVLWPDTVTPAGNFSDGGGSGITTATGVLFAAGGGVAGVRFWVPTGTTSGEQIKVGLWQFTASNQSTGTLLASKDGGTGWDIHAGTWQTIYFDSVQPTDHTHAYTVGMWHSGGRYSATSSYFSSFKGDLSTVYAWGHNEDISSVVTGYTSEVNGSFLENSVMGLPIHNSGSGTSYFVSPAWDDIIVPHIALVDADFAITAKALTSVPQPVHLTLGRPTPTIAPKALTAVPGVVHVPLTPAYIFSHASLIGNVQVVTAVQILWNVDISVQNSVDLRWGVRSRVSKSVSLLYNTRMSMVPSKVLSILYGVRKQVTKSVNIEYGVRVSVGSPKSVDIRYGVRSKVSQNVDIRYDTQVQGSGQVTKSVEILWHTMVTPTVNEVINEPFYQDPVPPQIITTTSF